METVIIATPHVYDAEFKQRLAGLGTLTANDDGTVIFEDGRSRVYVLRNDVVSDEFEPDRLNRITSAIAHPVFYAVDFSDIVSCRTVITAIADDPDVLVDNDHGVILPGPEFVKMVRSRDDWDWRQDVP